MRFGKHKKVKKKEVAANSAGDEKDRARAAMEAQYKRKPKPFYFRKNALLASCAVKSLFLLPRRFKRGPIYPSYTKRLEVYYRSVMKVADHHYLLSWEDLRNLYPVPRTPKDSYLRKVTLPCGLRGEFVCWVPKREAREIRKREEEYERLKARHEKEGAELPEESPYFRNKPTIMFLHGGGFCIGTVPSYRAWCWKLSKLLGGMQFFLPDYTLSPEVTFPVALQQCWKAYLWILNPKGGGIPADRLILAGDSAGGNLTLSLLYVIRQVRLEKERSELQKHRERRLSLSASGGGSFTTRSVDNQQHQQQREWEKGPVERWIEKEREREEVVTSEAVEKVLQTRRQQQKSKESGDSGDDDAAEADKTSEQRWPASDMTESQHRAWERRTLASDDKFMSKHQLPFELADDERDVFPPTPLAAVLLSPWVDLSEHSSVFLYRSYPQPEKFRPYHIGLRFVQGYLNLQPSDYPFTKKKERQLRRPLRGGLRAQSQERHATREKDRVRLKWVKKRWERKYLKQILYEELRLRQVDRDERRQARRRHESLASLRDEEHAAERERSRTDLHASAAADRGVGTSAGGNGDAERWRGQTMEEEEEERRRRRGDVQEELSDERGKERNKTSIYSPYISPVYGDLLGLPPLLITGGDVEPLWEDIRTIHHKAVEQGVEAELYVGHHMNHDFQFFFNVMPHPEVQRFFTHVKDWLEQRMNIRRAHEADLVRRHSLVTSATTSTTPGAGPHTQPSPDHARAATDPVDMSPPPSPAMKEAEPAGARLVDEQLTRRPTAEEPTYAAKDVTTTTTTTPKKKKKMATTTTGEGEVKVTVLPGKPPVGLFGPEPLDDEEEDLEALYAVRTPPYPV